MDSKLYTEILPSRWELMKPLWENRIILQFDNDFKHKSLQAYEFYQENNIRIIYWPSLYQKLIRYEIFLEE